MRIEARAGIGEQLLEDPAHRQHGRAAIDRRTIDLDLPHLAAGRLAALDHGDGETARGEIQRGTEAADPRANDNDGLVAQKRTPPNASVNLS